MEKVSHNPDQSINIKRNFHSIEIPLNNKEFELNWRKKTTQTTKTEISLWWKATVCQHQLISIEKKYSSLPEVLLFTFVVLVSKLLKTFKILKDDCCKKMSDKDCSDVESALTEDAVPVEECKCHSDI